MKIHIIGWSGITHSYSFAIETYFKGFLFEKDVEMYFTHCMTYNNTWKKSRLSFLDNLKSPLDTDVFDITFRMTYPYDYNPDPKSKLTIVFTTCEFMVIHNTNNQYFDLSTTNVYVLTPSIFSKQGLIRSFVPYNKIITIPHGIHIIDIKDSKQELRRKYKIPENSYVFFHNSSLTENKNPKYIFNGFNKLEHSNVILIIKGCDNIYSSKNIFDTYVKSLSMQIQKKIYYIGNDLTDTEMAELYTLSDCYLSPYIVEGFNIPVLEAMIYGLQVICTKKGPTDEFANAFFIDSVLFTGNEVEIINGIPIKKQVLLPDFKSMVTLMKTVITSPKKIDVSFYRNNYSENIINNILYKTFKNLLFKF